jgi:AraC family transcriptional regulator
VNPSLRDQIIYTPCAAAELPRLGLPLVARSVARFCGPAGACGGDVAKSYWHLEWVMTGALTMHLADAAHRLDAGAAVIVPPGLQRQFVAAEAVTGRGVSMVGGQVTAMVKALGYSGPGILTPGACPVADFRQLEAQIGMMTDQGLRAASVTAYQILTKAFAGGATDPCIRDPLIVRALNLLDTGFADGVVNINWVAAELGCHRCHLTHRFREQVGMAPGEYLLKRRLQRAMNRLRSSDARVAEVATDCGFGSPAYFSRIFRQKIGTSPTAFRREG